MATLRGMAKDRSGQKPLASLESYLFGHNVWQFWNC